MIFCSGAFNGPSGRGGPVTAQALRDARATTPLRDARGDDQPLRLSHAPFPSQYSLMFLRVRFALSSFKLQRVFFQQVLLVFAFYCLAHLGPVLIYPRGSGFPQAYRV